LTRNNLEKRQKLEDLTYLFCTEKESIHHLFFDCVIAKRAWELVSQATEMQIGMYFESVAKLWICNKKWYVVNIITSVVCWGLWKLRNSICFQDVAWLGMQMVWRRVLQMLRCWRVLIPLKMEDGFDSAISSLEQVCWRPEQIELSLGSALAVVHDVLPSPVVHFYPP
jgi:hypothetical protein